VPGTKSAYKNLPTEVAVVVSLRTGLVSRRGRGRNYLPAPAVSEVADRGRLDHTRRDSMAAAYAAMLADVVSGATTYSPAVVSTVGQELNNVVQIRLGDVFDVQRRRRDDLSESYVNVNL
jgi:hypothetical protein